MIDPIGGSRTTELIKENTYCETFGEREREGEFQKQKKTRNKDEKNRKKILT